MIGIFDSGVGGLCALYKLRELLPREDLIYLADRKNAPYGTKAKDEILSFTKINIKRLRALGAEGILIACCTASTLYGELSLSEREICTPIITPSAKIAATVGKKIAVIATEHTARSRAFSREIGSFSDCAVTEMAAQELVRLVECGNRDGRVSCECHDYLNGLSDRIKETGADTLILGCTHFSHLEGEIGAMLPHIKIISPAREGAKEIAKKFDPKRRECGRVIYM